MAAVIGQRCVLCGAAIATTREHIPPESFFHAPYPANLITVPACESCNLGTERDDAYALSFFCSLEYPGGSPTLERIRDRVRVKLNRQGYLGLLRRFREPS